MLKEALVVATTMMMALLFSLIVVVSVGHAWIAHRRRRREELAEQIRPLLAELLGDEEPDLDRFEEERRLGHRMVDELAEGLLGKLRGADRARFSALLERRGTLRRARRRVNSTRATTRADAAQLLGAAGAPGALSDLVMLLRDRRAMVRVSAARSLGRLGDPSAVPFLLDALATGPRSVPFHTVTMALFRIGSSVSSPLTRALGHPLSAARLAAAEVLGELGAVDATEGLVELVGVDGIGDPDPAVRLAAIRALDRIASPAAIAALRSLEESCGDAPPEPVVQGSATGPRTLATSSAGAEGSP